ncbi:DUF948 domain-containing protein [Bacillus sp. JCM 19034]|uniref:DUF948 domain-containing protein n=1 Tax=Bacillus sp. JCM 19034 TaxID=1481928 RepID=UPI000784B15B|nr:DUF948 domain-containing protein [Bacillus sp. JCM 19034]
MEIILYISALIFAVAFTVLTIYIVKTAKSADRTLKHLEETMAAMKVQINGISNETEKLLHRTNELAEDIQEKSQSMNSIFASAKELGDSINQITHSIRHMSTTIASQANRKSDQVAQVVQWGSAALDLYSKYKEKKNATKTEED